MADPNVQQSQVKLSEDVLQRIRESAKKSLFFFAKSVLQYDKLDPNIHRPIADLLQNNDNKRLRIILPRGWFKTTLCSIAFPVWSAINNPNVTILLVQNTSTNAKSKLRAIDGIFKKNDVFRTLFPEILPDKTCMWNTESMCVKRTGTQVESTFEAAGVKTQVVSRHYNIIIEDDTVAPDKDELGEENMLPTKDDIDQAIGWHRLATPLLTDIKNDRIIVIGTRWFDKDLLSWIGDYEKHYLSYIRASLENEDGIADEKGSPTWASRFPLDVLDQIRTSLGPYIFSCLYLNKPVNTQTMVFHKDWFKFFTTEPDHGSLEIYTTVDLNTLKGVKASKKGKDTDYTIVLTAGKDRKTGYVYVLDYVRKRMTPGEQVDAIFAAQTRWKPKKVLIEAVAYQDTLEYWVRERMRETNVFFLCEGITPGNRSKEERIRALQPLVHSGVLFFHTWMSELLSELEAFPLGAHDDVIDCLALQLPIWSLTVKEKKTEEEESDPFSFETLVKELRGRNKPEPGIYDVFKKRHNRISAYLGVN